MNIAIAIDFSMESQFAIRWALDLRDRVRQRGRPVDIYAITIPADVRDFQYRTLSGLPTKVTESSGTRHRIVHQIREFLQTAGDDVDDVQIAVDEGNPAEVISEFCLDHDIDWLVCGMDSTDALSRLMLGSTVHDLRERAPCNMVVVHPEHARLKDDANFAAGIDFLPGSDAALLAASQLTDLTDAHLHLVHALKDAPTGSSTNRLRDRPATEVTRLAAEARDALDQMMDEVRTRYEGLEYNNVIDEGPARNLLVDVVERRRIDAVFLGNVDHSTVEKWFFGSVSKSLLKQMPTTLVLVPPEAPD